MSFAIATLEIDGQAAPALLLDGRFWPAAGSALVAGLELPGETVLDWLRHWDVALERLRRLAAAIEGGLSGVTPIAREAAVLLAPVRPAKLFCIGANYTDHLEEMGVPRHLHPDPAINPYFFLKPGSTAVVGAGDTVFMPARCTLFDWEAEAAVVFGKGGRNISGADAMSHVAGYTLAIDFTARNQMSIPDHPLRWDLTLGKCQDAMTPIGPVLVPAEFVDGDDFHFSLSVNGVRKQAASTAGMIHSIARQIETISEGITIEPGDVMLTGSPSGVGMPNGEKLSPGDVVVIESAATGPMRVVIQAPVRSSRQNAQPILGSVS